MYSTSFESRHLSIVKIYYLLYTIFINASGIMPTPIHPFMFFFKKSFHFLEFLILSHDEGLYRTFFLVLTVLVQDGPVWTSCTWLFSTEFIMLYILGNFAVHALTIFHKRNLLIPKLSIIFLQKFIVIILQNVSEYSHDPFDSYENDY